MSYKPVVIVLAAGKGERFLASGSDVHKLAAPLAGMSVFDHVIAAVQAASLPMHIVYDSPGLGGMADSIAAGVRATADASGWLILPGDLPLIQATTLQRVAAGLLVKKVVVPHYRKQKGHPVAFDRTCFDDLSGLSGEEGARAIVETMRLDDQVLDLVLDDAGMVTDIDTLDDLSAAEQLLAQKE